MAPQNEEREMTTHQRSLVNNCFEEGQYEFGMAVLDQLRSPSFKPPPDLVRQLLYIALFPPPTGDQLFQQEHLPPSPVRGSPTKQKPAFSKTSLSPSVAESQAAQRLLFSFLATNSPTSLFRALPRYPLHDATLGDLFPESSDTGHDEDSVIAREALCIKDCKNCLVILKPGFIQRKKLLPQDSRRKPRRGAYDVEDAPLDQACDTPAAVAEHAWPILQWLLALFEKDELLRAQKSGGGAQLLDKVGNNSCLGPERFSLLLLSQIPPPRGGTGTRWDAAAPLDIIFHSIEQEASERREIATRLSTLLINLTLSAHFDGSQFAASLTSRLHTSPIQTVHSLMEGLPKTIPVLTFKITVYQRSLSSPSSTAGGTKPRPRPLLRNGSRRELGVISSATENDTGQAGSSLSSRPALATCSEVFQLLSSDRESAPPVHTIKYSLLMSYAQLQELLPAAERDSDWRAALSNGELRRVIDRAFPSDSTYHKSLTIVTSFWPAS